MDAGLVLGRLQELHREIEEDAGCASTKVTAEVKPYDELEAFDSTLIPGIIRAVAKTFGLELKKGSRLKNPYIKDGKELPLKDVAVRFCELYGSKSLQ